MKSAWVALALASLAYAQNNSTSTSIPSGLSQSCTSYLTNLNTDPKLNDCLSNLIGATSDFGTGSTPSAESVNNVLNTLCAPTWNHCKASDLRTTLVEFYSRCSADLLGQSGTGEDGNRYVLDRYDYIYLLSPLKDAMCTKDNDGAYCINKLKAGTASLYDGSSSSPSPNSGSVLASSSASSSSSSAAASPSPSNAKRSHHLNQDQMFKRAAHHHNNLVARQQSNSTQTTINADEFRNNGLPYLFLTPQTATSQLCSLCTYNILTKYITFESITPYALGISNSPILKGQLDLWTQVKTCTNGLASAIVTNSTQQAAASGALQDATVYGGATMIAAIAAALFGAVTLF